MSILSQEFVFAALNAAKAGEKFPINFDDVWAFSGYSRKDAAIRFLLSLRGLRKNRDFSTQLWKTPTDGRSSVVYGLTVDGFKFFLAKSNTEQGDETLWTLIEIEKTYVANLERQFAQTNTTDLQAELETVREAYAASQQEVYNLSCAVVKLEQQLEPFKKQLETAFDFDLDLLWSMSGLTSERSYLVNIVLNNFVFGRDFNTTPSATNGKPGYPATKYYLTNQCFNILVVSLRSLKGVDVKDLPENLVINVNEFYRNETDHGKNKRFGKRRKAK